MSDDHRKFNRSLRISWTPNPITGSAAVFLWGPRQTGKTTLLHDQLPDARYYDLLDSELRADLSVRPRRFREEVLAERPLVVVIDEVQEVPELLPEIHWLLENTSTRFVLCGSSARKLKRKARNLLGGRAVDFHLLPLTSDEVPGLDLLRLFNHGALPIHYLVDDPAPLLRAYVNTYIKEEIIDESATRNIPAFSRFLQIVGLTHCQQLNYTNIARETGVSANTVRSYFDILSDTQIGFALEPWRKQGKRRLSETAKFYLFDVGLANYLHPEAKVVAEGSDLYGRSFEHFLISEVRAFLSYRRKDVPLAFWRTSTGHEVDLILGDMDVALEFKSATRVRDADLSGLRTLMDDRAVRRSIVVSRDERPRRTEDGIEIRPWADFCQELWQGGVI